MLVSKSQAVRAIETFNEKYLNWDLKKMQDRNHSKADVVVLRAYMGSFSSLAHLGEIIVASTESFDECIKEYTSYWDFLIHGVNNRVEMGLVDLATFEYEGVTYYLLID